MVKFIRPRPVALAPREDHEWLLLTQRLLDPLEAGWQAALSTGDVDWAWALWTTAAEETLLALACRDITPDSLLARAALTLLPPHLSWCRGTDQLLREVRLCLPPGAHPGGPGSPPKRHPLAGAAGAWRGRDAEQGAVGVGGASTLPRKTPRAGPRVCQPGAGRHA